MIVSDILRRINILRCSGVSSILGIDLTETRIRVVELVIRGGIFNKYTSTFQVKNHFTIPLNHTISVPDRSKILAEELKIRKISTQYAATAIQSHGIRTVSALIPRSTSNIPEWIREHFEDLIKVPVPMNEIAFSFEILSDDQTHYSAEITFVRRSEIEQVQYILSAAGLTTLSISPGCRDALNTVHYSSLFDKNRSKSFIYVTETKAYVTDFEGLRRLKSNIIEKPELERLAENNDVVFAGEVQENINSFSVFSLPPEFTLAAGCALKGFISEFHSIQFLPVSQQESNTLRISRSLFNRSVIACGAFLIGVLLIQTIVSFYLKSKEEALEDQLGEIGLSYNALSQLDSQNKELRNELERSESLEYRSNQAELLHEIAAAVPAELWLSSIDINSKTNVIKISGLTSHADRIAEFLKRCESVKQFREVHLVRSGLPLNNEDLTLVKKKVSVPIIFQLQATASRSSL